MPNINDVKILELPKIVDPRGNLSFIDQMKDIPFEIHRAYWIYDVPGGCDRGGHAYKENEEFIVALSGAFDVELDDGREKRVYQLNRSYRGLLVPKGMWRVMTNFSTNSLALVLSSTDYNTEDYILDYEEFKRWANDNSMVTHSPQDTPQERVDLLFKADEGRTVDDCSLCQLNRNHHPEGNLTVIQGNNHVPFPIKRVFYSYDIPAGEDRGAHAHKHCHQFIVAASGCFDVVLDDGKKQRTLTLNRPFQGLHVPPGIWASEQGFCSGSICLVLASEEYQEDDYIRDYNDFIKSKQ